MPHVISDRDFSKLIEAHAGKPTMEDVYTKLAEAETDIQTGMVSDVRQKIPYTLYGSFMVDRNTRN